MSVSSPAKQLSFKLTPSAPLSSRYLVLHSGIVETVEAIEATVRRVAADPVQFAPLYLFGPPGCGKSHVIMAAAAEAASALTPEERIRIYRLQGEPDDAWVAGFIACYETMRSRGGLLFVEADSHPQEAVINPHVRSRLLAGEVRPLTYPREEELRPILRSLLERRNMRLSESSINYMMRRLPRDPLSFATIFAKIDELSLNESRRLGLGIVREVVGSSS